MARIIPSGWRELRATGAAVRDLETLALLASVLPGSCTVHHGVHWTQIEHGLSAFGEIDFIIVAPSGRMLVIEQKSGVLEEGSAGIAKVYAGKAKKVPVQILRSVGALRQRYARRRRGATLFIDYLLYCPDYTVRQPEIAGIEPERIVDATRRAFLPAIVESLLRPASTPCTASRASRRPPSCSPRSTSRRLMRSPRASSLSAQRAR